MKNSGTIRLWQIIVALVFMPCGQALLAQNWTALNGVTAQDISIGKNGKIWITAVDQYIYRWDGSRFEKIEGQAQQVAVDPNGNAWVVQASGTIYRFNPDVAYPGSWTLIPGSAKSLAIGANGSVWRIGTDAAGGGYGIYRWNGSNWDNIPGGAVQIAVDAAGNAWVVQSNGATWTYNPANNGPADTWVNMQVLSKNISIGADGTVWRIGTDQGPEGFGIYRWAGASNWTKVAGSAVRVVAETGGNLWAINSSNTVFRTGQAAVAANRIEVVPTTASAQTGKVRLQNTGQLAVRIFRATASNPKQELITEITGNSGLDVNTFVGDRFTVEFIDDPTIRHRTIFIPLVTNQTYFIYGNVPMKDFAGFGTTYRTVSLDPNLTGVDTVYFSRRDLVSTMNRAQIFERFGSTIATDYEIGDDNLMMKAGFSYSGVGKIHSTNKTRMSYGFSNFSNGWSIALSGSFPAGKVADIAGGFGYGQSQTTQSSSTDIYTYQRFQNITHQISVTPSKAYLDPSFIVSIRSLNTATDAANFIKVYGTHYPSVVFYGGDFSSYLKMTSTDFMEATSKKIDLQLEVSKATPTTTTKKGNTTSKAEGGNYGGKLDFSYNESTEERKLLEKSENTFKITGGEYNTNGDYSVNRNNAAPLAASLRRIDELITPEVIKDDINPAQIVKAQALIKKAIDDYIRNATATRPLELPPPVIYEVTLDKLQVTDHMDDLNSNTKGIIVASVYGDAALQNKLASPAGNLWEQKDYSLDFRYSPNLTKNFTNTRQVFLHYPDAATGQFNPFYLDVLADIREKDDILWAPDGALLKASSGPVALHTLNLQPGGPAASRSFTISSPGNGSIRVFYSIRKMENDFDSPGNLDGIVSGLSNQPGTTSAATPPSSEVEITLMNQGAFVAKFQVDYNVDGHAKSYLSGDVVVGWKHILPIPPNAQNVTIKAWSAWGDWKLAYNVTDPAAVRKCVKLTGVAFDPKWNNQCD